MYLFSRIGTIDPSKAQDAMAFAVDMCGHVGKTTGMEVHAWSGMYGVPLGQVSWSCRVDSHAAMGEATAKLMGDAAYQKKLEDGNGLFNGVFVDSMSQMVSMAGTPGPVGKFASIVSAQCAAGQILGAMAFGVDILEHVAKLTGNPMMLVRSMYGPWAGMAWISTVNSLDQVDAANDAMSADSTYIEKVDGAGRLFIESSATQVLLQRLD